MSFNDISHTSDISVQKGDLKGSARRKPLFCFSLNQRVSQSAFVQHLGNNSCVLFEMFDFLEI